MAKVMRDQGSERVRDILKKVKAAKVTDVQEKDFVKVLELCNASK
jgi:hypothetical protein